MSTALQQTEKIKTIFLETQMFYARQAGMPALIQYLDGIDKEFRSVAYESASMAMALEELEAGRFPGKWLLFANGPAAVHRAQVHVGLGWAIAKLNYSFSTAVNELDPACYSRIADGCGYYDGSFRRRQSVINKVLPAYLPGSAMPAYYQGLGRSTWYSQKTEVQQVCAVIESFPAERHADLWRGVGIAVAYVGGCADEDLKTLLQYASTNAFQLARGAALAVRSRTKANTMTDDTDRCSRLWFALGVGESNPVKLAIGIPASCDEDDYLSWVMQMEQNFTNSFEK